MLWQGPDTELVAGFLHCVCKPWCARLGWLSRQAEVTAPTVVRQLDLVRKAWPPAEAPAPEVTH